MGSTFSGPRGALLHIDLAAAIVVCGADSNGSCGLNVLLTVWIVWTVIDTANIFFDRRACKLVGQSDADRQLMALLRTGGIDLSEPTLQRLPAEVSLANQLLVNEIFPGPSFYSAWKR